VVVANGFLPEVVESAINENAIIELDRTSPKTSFASFIYTCFAFLVFVIELAKLLRLSVGFFESLDFY